MQLIEHKLFQQMKKDHSRIEFSFFINFLFPLDKYRFMERISFVITRERSPCDLWLKITTPVPSSQVEVYRTVSSLHTSFESVVSRLNCDLDRFRIVRRDNDEDLVILLKILIIYRRSDDEKKCVRRIRNRREDVVVLSLFMTASWILEE